jgi:hypothetical protein
MFIFAVAKTAARAALVLRMQKKLKRGYHVC